MPLTFRPVGVLPRLKLLPGELIVKRTSGSYQHLEHMPLKEVLKDEAKIDLFSDDDLIIGMIFGLVSNDVLSCVKEDNGNHG